MLAADGQAADRNLAAVGGGGLGEKRTAVPGRRLVARQPGVCSHPCVTPAGRPARAVPAVGRRTVVRASCAPGSLTRQSPDVIDQVVELLSGLPADERLEALGRMQNVVLDRIVQERVEGAGRSM